jgi:hypothetical protein
MRQRIANEPIRNKHTREYSQRRKIEKLRTKLNKKEQVSMTTLHIRTLPKSNCPGWSETKFNKDAINNIFRFAEIAKYYNITYENSHEDAFIVYLPKKQVEIEGIKFGLYVDKPKLKSNAWNCDQVVYTVDENKSYYMPHQFQ